MLGKDDGRSRPTEGESKSLSELTARTPALGSAPDWTRQSASPPDQLDIQIAALRAELDAARDDRDNTARRSNQLLRALYSHIARAGEGLDSDGMTLLIRAFGEAACDQGRAIETAAVITEKLDELTRQRGEVQRLR